VERVRSEEIEMKSAYRVLAGLVAAGVVFQVAVIAYEFFRIGGYVSGGGTLDSATLDSGKYPGAGGGDLHGTGAIVVAILALLLLISSFFAKIPGGVKWAAIVFGLVVLQWALAFVSFSVPALGFLHGINALVLFGCAMMAGMRSRQIAVSIDSAPTPTTAPVA
jgi:hypothetical protein